MPRGGGAAMTDGLVSTGVIGGASRVDPAGLAAVEAALSDLRSKLASQVAPSSFKAWFTFSNPWHGGPFMICVAADPDHEDAAKAEQAIEALPDTFAGFDVYSVPFPQQPVIGD